MASAVTVIFGANSTQFQAELARMQTMAAAAGRRMSTGVGGHMAGGTGMVRETAVIGREIAMGRGMGRILGSLTLLSQYVNSATQKAKQGTSAARELADAYQKLALEARTAAIAALKKAEATAAEAEMEGFEIDATLAAADASAAEAAAANAAAAALEAKALAAANAAAADEALAAANATASGSMAGALVFFALAVVIIGELYVIFKGLSEILGRVSKAQLMAAEYANEHRLAIWEEIEAMQKLKNATEKTSEALIRMNTAKDHSVELARQAIEASNEEMQARERLREASEKGKMVEIEIAEKLGFVTKLQAIQQKADVESQGIAEKAANKQAQLNKEALIAQNAAVEADTAKRAAQNNAVAASNVVNRSPEGMKRAVALANAEKNLEASKRDAEQAKKDQIEFNKGGSNILWSSSLKARMEGFKGVGDKSAALEETAESKSNSAASAEIVVNSLKRLMSPAEKAAAEAMRIAQEKTDAAVELGLSAQKATTAANINAANSPAEVAAEQRNVALKAMQETLGTAVIGKGYEMNQQQKAGAYAATPPEFKQMTDFLRLIAMQTHYLIPQSATAPGARGPQFGTRPPGR